jgi:3-oxoacyl-[acyl-carrier protein] reductase
MLSSKVAIVTGAASGFGAAISRMYETGGAKAVVADPNGEGAKKVASEPDGNAIAVKSDVFRPLDGARVALCLASDLTEFITGVELPVDGGRAV